ncbi:MAG: MFS transporter [Anaerolineales bacterium]|nr:MFS transporter [Anaerolineales bacterium]
MTETALPTPDTSLPRGMKTFLIIWLGELVSMIGSGLTGFALAVYIYQETGQATPFALTVLFGNLPALLLLPIAGSVADRFDRRWIMLLADCGAALTTLLVLILLFFGDLQIWHIYTLAFMGAVFGAFQEPAYTASTVMLVPKQQLARANGMVQMGQALSSIVTPLLAGFLFVAIGLSGIVIIDFVTFFFAIGALLSVRIPPPERTTGSTLQEGHMNNLLSDVAFGWQYLRVRSGLIGLLGYFAMVNFLLNFSAVLSSPLVLSNHPASVLGIVQMFVGLGMLAGGITLSIWGGPRQGRRIPLVIGFIGLAMIGLIVTGLRPGAVYISAGMFILLFMIPLASGLSQSVWQVKVAPDVQGRIFSIRAMLSRSMMPLAFLLAGPLADHVFEPLMRANGALANTFVGSLLGSGPGRGIGLIFVLSGLIGILVTGLVYRNRHIRNVEDELPDAVAEQPS